MEEWDMRQAARLSLKDSEKSEVPLRITMLDDMTAQIIYSGQKGDENLLEISYLKEIQQVERNITKFNNWYWMCWAGESKDGQCDPKAFLSPLFFLEGKDVNTLN